MNNTQEIALTDYANQLVRTDHFEYDGGVWMVVSKGFNNDPSLIVAKLVGMIIPKPEAKQLPPPPGSVMDLSKVLEENKTEDDLSFKLDSEKVEKKESKIKKEKK